MKYNTTILLIVFLLASQSVSAMMFHLVGSIPEITAVDGNNNVRLNPDWEPSALKRKLPTHITILGRDNPITDEILMNLNPEWWHLKDTLTIKTKNKLLKKAMMYPGGDWNNRIRRFLIAAALWIGASPVTKRLTCNSLEQATLRDDFELAKYILSKMSPDQKRGEEESFRNTKSIPMAKLLLSAGLKIPSDILISCCIQNRSTDLIQFYIQQGAQLDYQRRDGESALHVCSRGTIKAYPSQVALLLNAGADITVQNSNLRTPLHTGAYYEDLQFCQKVVQHYLDAHHAFLGFLWYLKKIEPRFYQCKDLRKLCFAHLSPMKKLKAALEVKDNKGKTAYEITRLDELNPDRCTYENLAKAKPH